MKQTGFTNLLSDIGLLKSEVEKKNETVFLETIAFQAA